MNWNKALCTHTARRLLPRYGGINFVLIFKRDENTILVKKGGQIPHEPIK